MGDPREDQLLEQMFEEEYGHLGEGTMRELRGEKD